MPISMEHEGDNLFRLDIRGTLRLAELDTCQEPLIAETRHRDESIVVRSGSFEIPQAVAPTEAK